MMNDNDRWEYKADEGWLDLPAKAEVEAFVYHGQAHSKAWKPYYVSTTEPKTLRRRPPEKDEWECYIAADDTRGWEPIFHPTGVKVTHHGYHYGGMPNPDVIQPGGKVYTTYSNPPTLRRRVKQGHEKNASNLPQKISDLETKIEVQHKNQEIQKTIPELEAVVEIQETPERPWWAKDDASYALRRLLDGEAWGIKPGDMVWDRVTGEGPFVVMSFNSKHDGSVNLWNGITQRDGHFLGRGNVWNDLVRPAVSLTTEDPNQKQSIENTSFWAWLSCWVIMIVTLVICASSRI